MTDRCARCHRSTRKVVIVGQHGYGPTCALKVQDQMPLRPKRVRIFGSSRRTKRDTRQVSLLTETMERTA
jgi:hypothetical protein